MKGKFIWFLISCLMVVIMLVTSCNGVTDDDGDINGDGGDGNGVVNGEDDDDGGDGGIVDDDAEMVLNSAGKLVERPRYGGVYVAAITSDFRGWDDVIPSTPAYSIMHVNLTNDELYTGDWAAGSQGTGEASWTSIYGPFYPDLEVPSLSTGYELPDNETIIWHIRQGVHFQDKPPANGREFNAHDAAFNLHRAFFTKGSYLFNLYRQDQGIGPVSVTALDDWTVEMKVPSAKQIPILFAASDYVFMFCPEAIEEYGDMSDWQNACGTGAFMLTDYVPVSSITYERNPDYWMKNPLHPEDQIPYIDGVEFVVVPDTATSQAAFRTGKMETRTVNYNDKEALLRGNPDLVWGQVAPETAPVIWMRQDKPELPYDDIRVRKALYYAIDHQSILESYYEGHAEMIAAPIANIPELQAMYTPLEEYSEEIQKLYGYYPEEARELLADAGYPDGFECTILSSVEGMLPIIKDMWAKIGVTMNIDIRTSAVVSSITMGKQHEDMYYGAEAGTAVLKCNAWRPDSYLNYSRVTIEEFPEWIDEFELNMLDWDKVCSMMKEFEPKMRERAYAIYLPASYYYFMRWPWLKGWGGEYNIGYYNYYNQMKYLWIDTELREELTGLSR